MSRPIKVLKLDLNRRKTVEAVDFIARNWIGVTQYYVCKILYFADKRHCLDWGRTITGDCYVAMDHGPVPSRVYEMLKPASGEEDELLDLFSKRLTFALEGNKIHLYSKGEDEFPSLSESDIEYLKDAIEFCKPLTFSKLRTIAHNELAWKRATDNANSSNPPMDLADWFEDAKMDREKGARELLESTKFGVR